MWVKCLEIPKGETPTLPPGLLPSPPQLPPTVLSPFFSSFSPLPSPLLFSLITPSPHTPKLMPHVMLDFLLPKGRLFSRHLPGMGHERRNLL